MNLLELEAVSANARVAARARERNDLLPAPFAHRVRLLAPRWRPHIARENWRFFAC
jgi:hypothetical protein